MNINQKNDYSDDLSIIIEEPNQRMQRVKDVLLIVLLAAMVFATTMFLLG